VSDFLPHVREPSSGEPDVCVHCLEEWVDLLTLYERDECSVRLRAEVERLRGEAERERAAVVAWLRGEAELRTGAHTGTALRVSGGLSGAADDIQSGEHRRKETE
jgi:hypothetical protein